MLATGDTELDETRSLPIKSKQAAWKRPAAATGVDLFWAHGFLPAEGCVHLRAELVPGKLSSCQVSFPSFHCHLLTLFKNGLTRKLLGQVPDQQRNVVDR